LYPHAMAIVPIDTADGQMPTQTCLQPADGGVKWLLFNEITACREWVSQLAHC